MSEQGARPVVVGVDGSASAVHAVRWAAHEAAERRVPLRLVHSYHLPSSAPTGFVDPRVLGNAMRAEGRRMVSAAREAAIEAVPNLNTELNLTSSPLIPLLTNESRDASMVVLGSRGLGGFTGLIVGSTAVHLAGRAHCPLVVVRGRDAEEPAPAGGPVVVGVDGAATSEAAIAFAVEEAAGRGCTLIAVHAWADSFLDTVALGTGDAPDWVRAQREAYQTLTERLAGWQEKYPALHVEHDVVRDRPARALLRHTAGARMVVVGTRGRGGFAGLLLGSTGQHLLHHAPCPVAIVRTDI